MKAPQLPDKDYAALRPSEKAAYDSPAGYIARDFKGSCQWEEKRCTSYGEAFETCIAWKRAGGRPSILVYGYDKAGRECRCLIPTRFNRNYFLRDYDAGLIG